MKKINKEEKIEKSSPEVDVEEKKYVDFEYEIGDKTYVQKALVLGQIKLLTDLLKTIDLPKTLKPVEIAVAVEEVLPTALAIVLIEKDKTTPGDIQNRDIEATSKSFEWTLDSIVITRVIGDFLYCNPVASVLKLMNTAVSTMYVPNQPTAETKTEEKYTGSIES
jgi:hypothetical protein